MTRTTFLVSRKLYCEPTLSMPWAFLNNYIPINLFYYYFLNLKAITSDFQIPCNKGTGELRYIRDFSHLLHIFADIIDLPRYGGKQCGPRSGCSYMSCSSQIWGYTVSTRDF